MSNIASATLKPQRTDLNNMISCSTYQNLGHNAAGARVASAAIGANPFDLLAIVFMGKSSSPEQYSDWTRQHG